MLLNPRWREEIQRSADLTRIMELARRRWTEDDLRSIHLGVDAATRKLGGNMTLRLEQAQALFELTHCNGVFCPMPVSGGKTLVLLLAPRIMQRHRPAFLVTAALVEKTEADIKRYAEHFHIQNIFKIFTYETLGRTQSKGMLEAYQPDILLADEAHRLKNRTASVTKEVAAFRKAHPHVPFVPASGTITTRSMEDYAHLLNWTLGIRSPVPMDQGQIKSWAGHIDEKKGATRVAAGALLEMCDADDLKSAEPGRSAYRKRLADTMGFVGSRSKSDEYQGSLLIDLEHVELPAHVELAMRELRRSWKTPNGEAFDSAIEMYAHARELAVGFFYHWDPPPPEEWMLKRKVWASECRYILTYNHRDLRTPLEVVNAIDKGLYPDAIVPLEEWRAVRDTYEHRTVDAWLSFFLIEYLVKRMKHSAPTLYWVNHKAFGKILAAASGAPYYAQGGVDSKTKMSIEQEPGGRSVIVSVASNLEGRNLQDRWSRNVFINPPPNGKILEQMIGRTHRSGQLADEVLCSVIVTCPEHEFAIQQGIADQRQVAQTVPGSERQKLLIADFLKPFSV